MKITTLLISLSISALTFCQTIELTPSDDIKNIFDSNSHDEYVFTNGEYNFNQINIDNKSNITIKNKDGHSPKIVGYENISSGWTKHPDFDHIYYKDINYDVWQLWFNDENINPARWPNVDSYIETPQPMKGRPLPRGLWDQDHMGTLI